MDLLCGHLKSLKLRFRFDKFYFESCIQERGLFLYLLQKYDIPLTFISVSKNVYNHFLLYDEVLNHLMWYRRQRPLFKRFVQRVTERYRSHLVTKEVIARNTRDHLPDLICPITYHKTMSPYWVSAFSGRFNKDLEDGRFVVRVNRINSSQEAVAIYCNRDKKMLYDFLTTAAQEGIDRLEAVVRELQIGQVFMDEVFIEKVAGFFNEYLYETLYKLDKTTSLVRLQLFVSSKPVIAEYIWKTNLNTKKKREILGSALSISKRNIGGFVRSETIGELKKYIELKTGSKLSILDQLPKHLWDKITRAQEDYEFAKCGVRVGLYGRYISSDAIQAANHRLQEAWKEADRWIGRNAAKDLI